MRQQQVWRMFQFLKQSLVQRQLVQTSSSYAVITISYRNLQRSLKGAQGKFADMVWSRLQAPISKEGTTSIFADVSSSFRIVTSCPLLSSIFTNSRIQVIIIAFLVDSGDFSLTLIWLPLQQASRISWFVSFFPLLRFYFQLFVLQWLWITSYLKLCIITICIMITVLYV